MRLWPYQMLKVLPNKYIVAQWRECLGVAGCLASEKGLNHATVNRVKDYDISHFIIYCDLVRKEMKRRFFTVGTNTIEKLDNDIDFTNQLDFIYNKSHEFYYRTEENKSITVYYYDKLLFGGYHNMRYIQQCYFMFEEKHDCGMLSDEEFKKVYDAWAHYMTGDVKFIPHDNADKN